MIRYLFGVLALGILAWAAGLPWGALGTDFFFWRHQGILLSGVLATATMGGLLLLALRPRWLEQRLGGLDRLYRLHKWSGITTGVLVVLHWGLTQSPGWLISLGWLEAPTGRRHGTPDFWVGLARDAGEQAFYALLLLLLISLIRAVPYHWFRRLHRFAGLLFLLAAFHAVWLVPSDQLWQPYGLYTLFWALAGSLAAVLSLIGLIGRRRRHSGQITALRPQGNGVLELEIQLDEWLKGYLPGQFVLLSLDPREGVHPFTILAGDAASGRLRFAIKGLGDYTLGLSDRLRVGDPVTVEGPYGRFVRPVGEAAECWIAGGIGITPFVAWLEDAAAQGRMLPDVQLHYCVPSADAAVYLARLEQLCGVTGVKLQVHFDDRDGRPTADTLGCHQEVPVWFCGPEAMARSLRRQARLRTSRFHHELFSFR